MTRPQDKRKFVSKVNTSPTGLQNLLGNINQGINPHELDHRISPGIDLYPFLSARKLLSKFATGSVAGTVGQGLSIEVPEGELWQVIAMECAYRYSAPTTDDTAISVGILDPSLTTMISFYSSIYTNLPGDGYQIAGGPVGERFILSGGWNIRGQVDASSVATARVMNVKALYIKLTE